MYVYFALAYHERIQMLKVGIAASPKHRIADLQVGCPFPLTLLSYFACNTEKHARNVERRIHKRFRHLRSQGEWFEYTAELRSWLRESHMKSPHEPQSPFRDPDWTGISLPRVTETLSTSLR